MTGLPRRRVGAILVVLLTALLGCAVHDSTAAATSILGYWSAEATRGSIALEIREHHGTLLAGRCMLRTPNPLHIEPCTMQITYVDSAFRTSFVTYSFRWAFDGHHESVSEIRGRLTGATFTGPMDETVTFVKTPRPSPIFDARPTSPR